MLKNQNTFLKFYEIEPCAVEAQTIFYGLPFYRACPLGQNETSNINASPFMLMNSVEHATI